MGEHDLMEKQDPEEVVDECIELNWSEKRIRNLLSDYGLEDAHMKELMEKVKVAKSLKKAARDRDKAENEKETEKNKDINESIAEWVSQGWNESVIRSCLVQRGFDSDAVEELIGYSEELRLGEKTMAESRNKVTNIEVKSLNPEQLEFFDKALMRISTKEDQRGLEAIVKELVRLDISNMTIRDIIRLMGIDNERIKDAAKKIDHL